MAHSTRRSEQDLGTHPSLSLQKASSCPPGMQGAERGFAERGAGWLVFPYQRAKAACVGQEG